MTRLDNCLDIYISSLYFISQLYPVQDFIWILSFKIEKNKIQRLDWEMKF